MRLEPALHVTILFALFYSQACGDDSSAAGAGGGGGTGTQTPSDGGNGGAATLDPESGGGSGGAAGAEGFPAGSGGASGDGGAFGGAESVSASGSGGQTAFEPEVLGGNAGMSGAGDTPGGAGGGAGAGTEEPGCVEFTLPGDCPETSLGLPLPSELRCTGLYGDWPRRTRACGVREYAPAYELWSDGAEKHRFVALPAGASIDASDPDNWVYPVGTQFWKEFWVGPQKRLGETRLLRKTAQGWLYTTYVWSEDGSTAVQTNTGVANWSGTGHTVPTRDQCRHCHSGRPDFILGWDLVLLGAGAHGVTREELESQGVLTGLPAGTLEASIPGSAVERAALGYLHVNCGVSCHNATEEAPGRSSTLLLRLDVSTLGSVDSTDAVSTGLNEPPATDAAIPPEKAGGPYYDLRPLDPERSLILERMKRRNDDFAMPRFGTNRVDPAGVQAITTWIEQMTPENGYPAPSP